MPRRSCSPRRRRRATRSPSASISTTRASGTLGRHGCDLDRVCKDIREDFCGEHGLAEIDRRIHSAQAVWSGGVLQLWFVLGAPHASCRTCGGLPRRLAARQRWRSRQQTAPVTGRQETAPVTGRQRCRQNAGHAEASRVRTRRCERGAPRLLPRRPARRRTPATTAPAKGPTTVLGKPVRAGPSPDSSLHQHLDRWPPNRPRPAAVVQVSGGTGRYGAAARLGAARTRHRSAMAAGTRLER